jgi:hypothetical protein
MKIRSAGRGGTFGAGTFLASLISRTLTWMNTMAEETTRRTTTGEKTEERKEERREERQRRARRTDLVIVDLGRKSRRDVRDLRKGRGPLIDDVEDSVEELKEAGALSAGQTVVVIVEKRLFGRGGMIPIVLPPGIPMLPMLDRDDDDEDDEDDDD